MCFNTVFAFAIFDGDPAVIEGKVGDFEGMSRARYSNAEDHL